MILAHNLRADGPVPNKGDHIDAHSLAGQLGDIFVISPPIKVHTETLSD